VSARVVTRNITKKAKPWTISKLEDQWFFKVFASVGVFAMAPRSFR
jgi:hypothetical protein